MSHYLFGVFGFLLFKVTLNAESGVNGFKNDAKLASTMF